MAGGGSQGPGGMTNHPKLSKSMRGGTGGSSGVSDSSDVMMMSSKSGEMMAIHGSEDTYGYVLQGYGY